jgi:hypothetical protein
MLDSSSIEGTLPEPIRPKQLSEKAQWLAGEGAGSWFLIELTRQKWIFKVTRYSPIGDIECEGSFEIENTKKLLVLNKPYRFIHLSHCAFVHIEQEGKVFRLVRKMHHRDTEHTEK